MSEALRNYIEVTLEDMQKAETHIRELERDVACYVEDLNDMTRQRDKFEQQADGLAELRAADYKHIDQLEQRIAKAKAILELQTWDEHDMQRIAAIEALEGK